MQNPDGQMSPDDLYAYAMRLKKIGSSDLSIRNSLMEKGLSKDDALIILDNVNEGFFGQVQEGGGVESGGGEFPRWLIYVLALVGINVLSFLFDWGFWIY